MATLAGQKVKDAYQTLLKLTSGTLNVGFTTVEDGAGNSSGLSVSTTGVGVTELTFATTPLADPSETTVLLVNSGNKVVSRELSDSAFITPVFSSGTGISVSGTYPSFTISNTSPDVPVSIGSGSGISVSGSYPNFSVTNSAPDQVVSVAGTGGISPSGTYPNFSIDGSDLKEELLVAVPETTYPLSADVEQVISFTAPDNTTSNTSFHFGYSPAKLSMPATSEVLNSSGVSQIIYIDMAAYVDVTFPNSDITYTLETNAGPGWFTKQQVTRVKSTIGQQVDSFWAIFIIAAGEKMRIKIVSSTGSVALLPSTQIKFEVKQTGNIL